MQAVLTFYDDPRHPDQRSREDECHRLRDMLRVDFARSGLGVTLPPDGTPESWQVVDYQRGNEARSQSDSIIAAACGLWLELAWALERRAACA